MFAIYCQQQEKYFCKDHSKIIVFKDTDKANWFLNQFGNFAMTQILGGGGNIDLMAMAQIPMVLQTCQVVVLPETTEAETIDFDEISNI